MSKSDSTAPKPLGKRIGRWVSKEIFIPIIMAVIVIQFVIQAFKIPSSSMEDSLLVGDFLLGLKFVYGSPIPFSDDKFPGFSDPETGDVIIFRYPGEPEYPDYDQERYSHVANLLMLGNFYWDSKPKEGQPSLVHYFQGPKDFIKRCVAVSGDKVQLSKGNFYLNDTLQPIPGQGKQTDYSHDSGIKNNFGPLTLPSPQDTINLKALSITELYHYKNLILQENPNNIVEFNLALKQNDSLLQDYRFDAFTFSFSNDYQLLYNYYASHHQTEWSKTSGLPINKKTGSYWYSQFQTDIRASRTLSFPLHFSKFRNDYRTGFLENKNIEIPGLLKPFSSFSRPVDYSTVFPQELKLIEKNIALVNEQDTISNLSLQATISIDGKAIDSYVVKQPVYFAMGDNRDNSADSRYWGFLSHRNVKAKAFLVYFSFDHSTDNFYINKPWTWWSIPLNTRWTRIGRLIHGL